MLRDWLFIAGACLSLSVCADTAMLQHLYVDELSGANQARVVELRQIALEGNYDEAVSGASSMLAASGFEAGIDDSQPISLHDNSHEVDAFFGLMLFSNYSLFLAVSGDLASAQMAIDRAFVLAATMKPGSSLVVKASMADGLISLLLKNFEAAVAAFKRVQLLVHQQDGVASVAQLDALALLSLAERMRGNFDASDQYQESSLLAVARTFGETSPEMLAELIRIGGYYAARGANIPVVSAGQIRSSHACLGVGFPFNTCDLGLDAEESGQLQRSRQATELRRARESAFLRSIVLLEDAIKLHDLLPDNKDYNKVRILRAMASAQLQKGDFNRAQKTMMDAIRVSEQSSYSSQDRLEVLLATGDLLQTRGGREARAIYLKAWQLLQADQGIAERHGSLFQAPLRLIPERFQWLPLAQQSTGVNVAQNLYVRVVYDVSAKGRIEQIKVVESTLPGKHVRDIKQQLKRARFRPRIHDGKFVSSKHHALRFNYPVRSSAEK